eukprot:1159929-Pelagomonas_calceolata.AAC.13
MSALPLHLLHTEAGCSGCLQSAAGLGAGNQENVHASTKREVLTAPAAKGARQGQGNVGVGFPVLTALIAASLQKCMQNGWSKGQCMLGWGLQS